MLSFWIICALLIIAALIIILPSLITKEPQPDLDCQKINLAVYESKLKELERDLDNDLIKEEKFEVAKLDLQRTLLDDMGNKKKLAVGKSGKILPIIVALIIPIVAVLTYLKLNNGLVSLSPDFQLQLQAQQQGQMPSVEDAIASLEQKLKQDPKNLDGWLMLGRSYLISEKFDAAVYAYAKANEITQGVNPDVLVAYGEAQGFAAGQKFDKSIMKLFTRALRINPDHERGLWYAGFVAYQLKDFKSSVNYWERLMRQIPMQQEQAKIALQTYLNDARRKVNVNVSGISQMSKPAISNQAGITVTVFLAAKFSERIKSSDTLFIYARAQNGPKMPLALVKMTAGDLPTTVTLDDSVSMIPSMTLSSLEQVEVIARISKSGQAIMQRGDMYGSVHPVNTNKSAKVNVVINKLAPQP